MACLPLNCIETNPAVCQLQQARSSEQLAVFLFRHLCWCLSRVQLTVQKLDEMTRMEQLQVRSELQKMRTRVTQAESRDALL